MQLQYVHGDPSEVASVCVSRAYLACVSRERKDSLWRNCASFADHSRIIPKG